MKKVFCLLLVLGLIALTQQHNLGWYAKKVSNGNANKRSVDTRKDGIGSTGKRSADNRDSYGNTKRFADTAMPRTNKRSADTQA